MFEAGPADLTEFAHNSERQFARLLDFYGIKWDYEPRAFPLAWDEEGKLLGCVVNYACHATTSPGGISANWI